MKRSFIKVGQTFQNGNTATSTYQSTNLIFPYPECANAYYINTNASEWKLYGGTNQTPLDTQKRQFGSNIYYKFTNTTYYSNYTFVVSQTKASTSNGLIISNLSLTNDLNYKLHPALVSNLATYSSIPSGPIGGLYRGMSSLGGEFFQIAFSKDISAKTYTINGNQNTWKIETKSTTNQTTWVTLDTQINKSTTGDTTYSLPTSDANVFRFTCNTVTPSSSSNLQIAAFNLYDAAGTLLTRDMYANPATINGAILPTNVYCEMNTSNVLGYSPFKDSNLWTGTTSDWFNITFNRETPLTKIYIESSGENLINVYGNTTTSATGVLLTQTMGNGITDISGVSTSMYKSYYFKPRGPVSVSNILVFGTYGRTLNPWIRADNNAMKARYGGTGNSYVQVELPTGTSNGGYYDVTYPLGIVSYNVQALSTTGWVTIDERSNLYNKVNVTFSNKFSPVKYTKYKFNIFETMTGFEDSKASAVVSNINICYNSRTLIPPFTSTTQTLSDPLNYNTSIIGTFRTTASADSTNAFKLFDLDMTTKYTSALAYPAYNQISLTQFGTTPIRGEWFQIDFPTDVSVLYYTMTTSDLNIRAPKSWYLLGSSDRGGSWSNALSTVSGVGIQSPYASNLYMVSNTSLFTTFRFVCTEVVRDSKFELVEFAMYDTFGRMIPRITSAAESRGEAIYGGKYNGQVALSGIPGEWIELSFPVNVTPSYVNITSTTNKLPSNIQVYYGSPTRTLIGTYRNYIPTNTVTIPLLTTTSNAIYTIQACEMISTTEQTCTSFRASDVQFLDANKNKMNSILTTNPQTITTKMISGGPGTESITLTLPSSTTAAYYAFKCPSAITWNMSGSTDNLTFTPIDSRVVKSVNSDIYMYSIKTPSSYIYYRLTISNTNITNNATVSNFAVYDSSMKRIIKFKTDDATFTHPWTGGTYDVTKGKNLAVDSSRPYYGEWVTFQFPESVITDNVTISIDQTSSLLGFTLLGKNTSDYWNTISVSNTKSLVDSFGVELCNVYDSTITGTFTIVGSDDVIDPSNLFVMNSTCLLTRLLDVNNNYNGTTTTGEYVAPYVQIEFPVPTPVFSYKMYVPPRDSDDQFGLPVSWRLYASVDSLSWTAIHNVSNFTSKPNWYGTYVQFYTSVNMYPYTFYRLCVQTVSSNQSMRLAGLELLNSGGEVIYNKAAFVPGKNIQQVNTGKYSGDILLKFNNPVIYSNIGFVVYKSTNEPYFTDGKLKIKGVDFKPSTFYSQQEGGSNVYYEYSNRPTDVVNGEQYVQLSSTAQNIDFVPNTYSFNSKTANVWSFQGSTDGIIWDVLEDHVSGSTLNRKLETNGNGYSQYRLNIHSITNYTDATTDVSNLYIYSLYGPITQPLVSSNPEIITTNIGQDSYSRAFAVLELKNGF